MARSKTPRTNVPCSDAFAPELPSTRGGKGFEARMARANALQAEWDARHCAAHLHTTYGGAILRTFVVQEYGSTCRGPGLPLPYWYTYQGTADQPCG